MDPDALPAVDFSGRTEAPSFARTATCRRPAASIVTKRTARLLVRFSADRYSTAAAFEEGDGATSPRAVKCRRSGVRPLTLFEALA